MKEADIRPDHLHRRYLELSAQDADLCFTGAPRRSVPCVACGSSDSTPAFEKNGFAYASCRACGTLYQTPRPSRQAFEAFYQDSVSSRFWAEEFFPAVAESRRASIFRPRVERLTSLCREQGAMPRRVIDVGAGFGIFLEEWCATNPDSTVVAVEPSKYLAEVCRSKGLTTVERIVENVEGYDNYADLVVCFEVLEHVYDPVEFIGVLKKLAQPGGYIFVSTLCIDGFDIQVLWEKSRSVFPPHHINFMSVEGFRALFARAGLENVDVTTPGQLDVDIVRNAFAADSRLAAEHRFIQHILQDNEHSTAFQKFLSANRLSSHAWMLAKKSDSAAAASPP